jgi:hypothetical protein
LAQGNLEWPAFGNEGYCSKASSVLNMAGALDDTNWMSNHTIIPVSNAHGTDDQTVLYFSAVINFLCFFLHDVC